MPRKANTYQCAPNMWAQFSDEQLYAMFARKEGIDIERIRRFTRDQVEAMLTHRKRVKL